MRKIIFLIVFCFMFPVFAEATIEIIPKPINGVVATNKVAVRGFYNSNVKKLRIRVEPQGTTEAYSPVILGNIREVVDYLDASYKGFYQQGVELSSGNNRIVLEKFENNDWTEITYQNIEYNPDDPDAKETLWGRIANLGEHNNEEQRAVYFYPGTRFHRITASNTNFRDSENLSIKFLEIFSGVSFYSKTTYTSPLYFSKDITDTKGPGNPSQKCWSNKDTINDMMDEISNANANIVMFVYWGDNDETIRESQPEGYTELSENEKNMIDNFAKIYSAPTYPETCNYYLEFNDAFCIEYTDNPSHIWNINERTVVSCECRNDFDCNDAGKYCFYGSCFNRCSNEQQICDANQACNEYEGKCVPTIKTGYPVWHHYYTHRPNSNTSDECLKIYKAFEYENSGIYSTQGRHYDAIDQLFKAASDRNLLVVPTLEPSVGDMQNFEINPSRLKQRLLKLLEKYGNHPNWLQVYDKSGNPRKVIHISQAVGAPRESSVFLNGNSFKNTLDMIAWQLKQESHSDSDIGFLLDITAMPPDREAVRRNYYFPTENDLTGNHENYMQSLLGISTFGLPFDQYIEVVNQQLRWSDIQYAANPNEVLLPLEDHLFNKAKEWLEIWKNSGIPIIPDIIPGFDDRWRGPAVPSVFLIYGDNERWRERFAKLMFMYNTAGFNLTIWNGYGEGYVWVPYRQRKFENRGNYQVVNISGEPPIPKKYENLNLSVDNNGNPKYENQVVNDNYCFAQYLFGGDDDGDCIPNNKDNCRNAYNPMEMNSTEIVLASCDETGGGARCLEDTKKFTYKDENGNWWWQPDHDLDGIGDACDPDTVWSEFNGVPAGNSKFENVIQNGMEEHGYIRKNETLSVTINMKSTNPTKSDEVATTRYCWLSEEQKNLWGTDGYCTTEEKHNSEYDPCNDTNFGYSHGTDPRPIMFNKPTWKFIKNKNNPEESDEFTTITTNEGKTINWDWRYDFIKDNDFFENALTTAPQCENVSLGVCMDENVPKFYYTMSTGVHGTASNYLTERNEINPAFFRENQEKYARSSRLSLESVIISYHKEFFRHFFPPTNCLGAPCNFPIEWLHDIIIDRLINGPLPFEMPITEHYFKNAYGSDLINTGVAFREWSNTATGMPSVVEKSRPLLLLTITENASGMNEGILAVPNNTVFSLRNIQESTSNFSFEIVTMDANSNGDWRTKGVLDVSEVPNFMPITSTYHNRDLYVVSKNSGDTAHIYQIAKTDLTITPPHLVDICALRWIFTPIDFGTLPDLSNITLHSVGNSLFALGKSGDTMKVYKLSEQNGNPYFEDISGTNIPQGRDVYNVEIQDDVLYLAGGAAFGENSADLKTDIWRFTEADGWQLIRNDLNIFPVTLRIDFDGDNIILTDRVIRPNGTTNRAIFAADGTGDIVIETVPVEGAHIQGFEDYCLNETETAISGGLELGAECVSFTHPFYNSFSAGTTVYSVAGKGNRLYAGTNDSIKIYDISDPDSPVLVSSFPTNNARVNDLEIEGEVLFAATSKGLYKLDASDPDELEQILFFSTGSTSQNEIELYDGKVYVGDDNGIKIRDKETLSVLLSANSGQVYDFAIENGEIAMFRSSFWNSGIQFRNAENLVETAYDYTSCNDVEVENFNGKLYLACDNYTYSFEANNGYIYFTQLSGDKRDLRENYTYNGYSYTPDGNYIRLSTNEEVPAICGNGIVEGDEICDGTPIDCAELDESYVSGIAACNQTCDGYILDNCTAGNGGDGW